MEIVNEIIDEDDVANSGNQNQDNDPQDNLTNQNTAESVRQSDSVGGSRGQGLKKGKATNPIQDLCQLLGDIHKDKNDRLGAFAEGITYQADLGKARKKVFGLLQNIPHLSLDDVHDVGEILVDKPEHLEYFMGLPEEGRPAYVHRLMKKIGK